MEVNGNHHKKMQLENKDDAEPTFFATMDTKFLEVSKDKLSIKYIGKGSHAHDVGSIQANKPFPTNRMVGYYEVFVDDAGIKGSIYVGAATAEFVPNRQPGWEDGSYGYNGEDGKKYHEAFRGEPYSEPFTAGDVIGCGIIYHKQEMFFTKNGKFLGIAYRKVSETLYPTVGLHSQGETITANFGQQPFSFDLQGFVQEQRDKMNKEISSIDIDINDINNIIRGYLLHYGYADTLAAFEASSGISTQGNNTRSAAQVEYSTLTTRKEIRQAIMQGHVDHAIKLVSQYPPILKNTSIMFILHCQQFIEIVRQGENKTDEAISFAQEVLSKFSGLSPEEEQHLQNVLGLLAYDTPLKSPLSYLLEANQREVVADSLNKAILAIEQNKGENAHDEVQSGLEKVVRQLLAVQNMLREKVGNRGEVFHLDRI
mmetsp:Transcript_18268/g.25585  ORF Transcript_18268/g.25585 Transcript_18268/m.25585 type:complete len:427 (-) Transcript_18268:292-1572(-)